MPRQHPRVGAGGITLRTATSSDAPAIHALIAGSLDEGRLLPRTPSDIAAHVPRFIVAIRRRAVVGCAELAPLSREIAEVRSLVVSPAARHQGVGRLLVEELQLRARHGGFDTLCAFTHAPSYFTRLNFSIVPHSWLPDKVLADCLGCPHFRTCGQVAMTTTIEPLVDAPVGTLRVAHSHV